MNNKEIIVDADSRDNKDSILKKLGLKVSEQKEQKGGSILQGGTTKNPYFLKYLKYKKKYETLKLNIFE